jgi:large subunit ribosomal protein L10
MNREQKAAAIEEIAGQIQESEAIFAVDYRGITVPQAAELRAKLRDADASFRVVKNTLTERAADQAGVEALKALLKGPTALTFVRGDAATAAKTISDFSRDTPDILAFKGGLLNGDALAAEQIQAIAKLPSRDVLYGQLVGMVASPISGVVRTLNALIQGLALQLGQVAEKKEKGEIPAGEAPAAAAAEEAPAAEAEAAEEPAADAAAAPAGDDQTDQDAGAPEAAASSEAPAEGTEEATTDTDNQADASTESDETAEAKEN